MGTVEDFNKLRKEFEWDTRRGWIVYSLFILFITLSLLLLLAKLFEINEVSRVAILVLTQLFHTFLWWSKRQPIRRKLFRIAFAIEVEENSKKYYKEIIKNFKRELNKSKINDFEIIPLSSDVKFESDEKAEEYIKKHNVQLLIWGNTVETTHQGASLSSFKINFSYLHGIEGADKRKVLKQAIDCSANRKVWDIWKPDSNYGLSIVNGNITEISLFILGSCLSTIPNVNFLLKAEKILDNLVKSLKLRKSDGNFPLLTDFKKKVNEVHVAVCDVLQVFYYKENRDYNQAMVYMEKILETDSQNYAAHSGMALFKYLSGDEEGAIKHVGKCCQLSPGNQLCRINSAFFYLKRGKYEKALKQYHKIDNMLGSYNVMHVVSFLEDEYDKSKDLGLLFGSAWVNYNYADIKRARLQLEEFLEKTRGLENEYSVLIDEAKKLLNKE